MAAGAKWEKYVMDKITLDQVREDGKLKIPNYQRGVVWTKQHRKDFIETVKSGDPFGVVLVHQNDQNGQYTLIDGLQRLSTLRAYMAKPIDFVDENDKFVDMEALKAVFVAKCRSKGVVVPVDSKLEKEARAFLKKMIKFIKSKDVMPEPEDVWSELSPGLDITPDASFAVYTPFAKFYKGYLKKLELPSFVIHAIVYQGAKEDLPRVFETLNTSSVSLTKYEIFSSQWSFTPIKVPDESLIKKVWSKYDTLQKTSNFEVSNDEDFIRENGMTLFEYCFGLSELICDESAPYSFLFSRGKKSTDPTGFELLTMACKLAINKADQLDRPEYLGNSSGEFLVDLKDALIASISYVGNALKDWVHDMRGVPIKNGSTYQIYYMIMAVFNHMYEFDPKQKNIKKHLDKAWLAKFQKHAPAWYLYHQLSSFWNKNRQTSDLKGWLDKVMDSDFYITPVKKEDWKSAYDEYCRTLRDTATSRAIASESKLFLNYLYRLLIKEDKNREKFFLATHEGTVEIKFDIEHVTPFVKFQKQENGLPASALGNLCYLPAKDNRSKKEATLYEYADDRPALMLDNEFQQLIDYPVEDELEFIDASKTTFKNGYEKLLDKREAAMFAKFINLV